MEKAKIKIPARRANTRRDSSNLGDETTTQHYYSIISGASLQTDDAIFMPERR